MRKLSQLIDRIFRRFDGRDAIIACKIRRGDHAWKLMGGKFRYKGIPFKDRVIDYPKVNDRNF